MSDEIIPQLLDVRRLLCPMPVIRTQEKIKKMSRDEVLQIVCTDPGTLHDIPTWCRMYGHQLLLAETRGDELYFKIKVVAVADISEISSKEW